MLGLWEHLSVWLLFVSLSKTNVYMPWLWDLAYHHHHYHYNWKDGGWKQLTDKVAYWAPGQLKRGIWELAHHHHHHYHYNYNYNNRNRNFWYPGLGQLKIVGTNVCTHGLWERGAPVIGLPVSPPCRNWKHFAFAFQPNTLQQLRSFCILRNWLRPFRAHVA